MTDQRTRKSTDVLVTAELSALYEISSISFSGSKEALGREAVEKATRLFGVRYFALFAGTGDNEQLIASSGFRNPDDLPKRIRQNEPNQFLFFLGDHGKLGTLFMEQAQPTGDKERRLYILFARRLQYVLTGIRNITEREEAEEALRESEGRFKGMFENMSSGVAVYQAVNDGEDFVFVDFNPAGEKIEKIGKEDVIGRPVTEVFVGIEDFGLLDVFRRVWRTGQPERYPVSFYQDERIEGWRENFVYRLSSGEVVAIYDDVTARKRAEETLRESEERYRITAEQTGQMVYDYDPKTGDIHWLGAIDEITGYSIKEFSKVNVTRWGEMIHPEDREEMIAVLGESQERCARYDVTYRFRCKNGEYIYIEEHGIFLPDEQGKAYRMLGTMSDVTERKRVETEIHELFSQSERSRLSLLGILEDQKRIEEDLRRSETRFRELAELLPETVFEMDDRGTLTYINQRGFETFGYSREDLERGLEAAELCIPEERDRLRDDTRRILKGAHPGGIEYAALRKDGRTFPSLMCSTPIVREDAPVGLRGIILDISERKQMVDLRIAKEGAEKANQAKSEFLAYMGHELRTPLNAIIGFSEALEDGVYGKLGERQEESVQNILASGHHLYGLLNDILDLSKVEAGKMVLHLTEVDTGRLLEDSLIVIGDRVRVHDLNVDLCIPPEVADVKLVADERRLRQIMFNLLSNAAKFTPDGGKIMVTARPLSLVNGHWSLVNGHLSLVNGHWEDGKGRIVDLRVAYDRSLMASDAPKAPMTIDPFLAISVSDTGIGIKREQQDRVFERFQQLDTSYGREHEGTGLGLALAREFVEMHGGSIWVESEGEGKGSTFTFVIPIRPKSVI